MKGLEGPFYLTPVHNSGQTTSLTTGSTGFYPGFLFTNHQFAVGDNHYWSQLTTNGKFLYTLIFVPELMIFHQAIYEKNCMEEKLHVHNT